MFFSVIVPVYKVENYLKNCIESILAQTFSDFELILVDDGSPDSCPQICDEYKEKDSRIKVIHKENGGLCSARIAGTEIAEGEYVLGVDSDDLITPDTLESAYNIIKETNCEIVSFAYSWVKNSDEIKVTDDTLPEGLYETEKIKKYIYPKILMDKDMNHISYYLSGKVIKREFLLPHQLGVSEKISLGEDLCCTLSLYLNTKSVYISKKKTYLYTVRDNSLSKEFNSKQIFLIENVINEIKKYNYENIKDFENQLCRYSLFMCFTILAAAAEGGYFKNLKEIEDNIKNSVHYKKIPCARFDKISIKSKITVFLMKRKCFKGAFYFLNLCKRIKTILRKG